MIMYGRKPVLKLAPIAWLSFVLAVMGVLLLASKAARANAPESVEAAQALDQLKLQHILFHQFEGDERAAYEWSLYYGDHSERSQPVSFDMLRGGLALSLGLRQLGLQRLSGLDETALSPVNQLRLHEYLARDAYRRRDWSRLGHELAITDALIAEQVKASEASSLSFLRVEYLTFQQQYAAAELALLLLGKRDPLRGYAGYNLAMGQVRAGQFEQAESQLRRVFALPASGLEQVFIAERARLGLAALLLQTGRYDEVQSLLQPVLLEEMHGPTALVMWAEAATAVGDHATANKVLGFLNSQSGWGATHRYALMAAPALQEQGGNPAAAFELFGAAELKLANRAQSLLELQQKIEQPRNISLLADFVHSAGSAPSSATLVNWLNTQLGHQDWPAWLAGADARQGAAHWEQLMAAAANLNQHQQNLQVLAELNEEQVSRLQNRAEELSRDAYLPRIDASRAALEAIETELNLAAASEPTTSLVSSFATPPELDTLGDISRIEQAYKSAMSTGAGYGNPISVEERQQVQARLARLRGLVQFKVMADLPVRIQDRRSVLQRAQARIEDATARADRIRLAIGKRQGSAGEGARLVDLSARVTTLHASTNQAFAKAAEELMASLTQNIANELDEVSRQRLQARYARTRIADAMLVAGGER